MHNTTILYLLIEKSSVNNLNAPFVQNTPTVYTPTIQFPPQTINAPFVKAGDGTTTKAPNIILLTNGKLAVRGGGIVYIPM